jgi:alginate biosynthesis protein Alg44
MNTAVNVNVVHESEAQRQYARVKLPAKIRFTGSNRETVDQRLIDLSAGGFAFTAGKAPVQVGDFYKGKLLFQIDNLSLGIDVEFQVREVDQESGRIGCEFHNLKPREIATLRHLITSHLSGELVNVGDLLNTLQRENFTKARKSAAGGSDMGFFGRTRAALVSLVILACGVAAFAYIFYHLYDHYFVTHAESAQVSVPYMQVTMPREGTVESLVPADGMVKKGAPIATFSATMLEMLRNNLTDEQLTPQRIEQLFGRTLKGTLTSPCDCRVVQQLVADGQFASKGAPIFNLAPTDSTATVEARFRYTNFDKVLPGTKVTLRVAGEDTERTGKIVSTQLQDGGLSSDIRVMIQPDGGMTTNLAGRPVDVVVNGANLSGLVDKARAAGF